jgi:hypothetical protein
MPAIVGQVLVERDHAVTVEVELAETIDDPLQWRIQAERDMGEHVVLKVQQAVAVDVEAGDATARQWAGIIPQVDGAWEARSPGCLPLP